ncbi:fimbria/pilus periplasmic chaperone [Escherichia coli]|nr:fimbria/pilus periplasmic chaperone [Escherichia coli]
MAQLPNDRETLFYFNVREIPPKQIKKCDASHYAARIETILATKSY